MTAWYGAFFRAGTPEPIIAAMREVMRKGSAQPAVTNALTTFVHEPLNTFGEDVVALNRNEINLWTRLVRERGIKFD
jgi:tripartite-type tricarboxylate transporter receptor subunit TctC